MLPCESNFKKSHTELVHELEINHERVNSSAEGARRLFLENEQLKTEQRRQAELYVLALRERAQFAEKVKDIERWRTLAADWKDKYERINEKFDQLYLLARSRRVTKAQLLQAILG